MAGCLYLLLGLAAYSLTSKILFDSIYQTSNVIVDEEFHLPLGEQYCIFNFFDWDPKVTTLPGLYLISALLLGPFDLCSIYWLRLVSLIFSCINLILFYILFSNSVKNEWQKVFLAVTINFLPPLYFFSHVYYTDVVSLTSILIFIILHQQEYHYFASIAGFFSIICRQTNVIFVAIYGGKYILEQLYVASSIQKDLNKAKLPFEHLKLLISETLTDPLELIKNIKSPLNCLSYVTVLMSFVIFVILNQGIVVGDRNAHTVSIHIPQLFYFSLFCLIFGWPHFGGEVLNFLTFAKRHKLFIIFSIVLTCFVIKINTIVHPYLLADNRHLIFYFWSKLYGKYWWFRYAMVPVYIFALYVIFKAIWDPKDVGFGLMFTIGVSILLTTQALLEVRYFIVPYIIIRFKMKNVDSAVFNMVLEFVTYSVINVLLFNIFFTRELYWADMEYIQRIIW